MASLFADSVMSMQGFYASLLVPKDEDVSLDERCRRVATFAGRSPITAKPRQSIWNVGACFSPINLHLPRYLSLDILLLVLQRVNQIIAGFHLFPVRFDRE